MDDVVRGERQDRLGRLLRASGWEPAVAPPLPRVPGLQSPAAAWVRELYVELGGSLRTPSLKPVGWDLSMSGPGGRLVIELDEEQHFTRYRRATLAPAWADALPWAEEYRDYCDSGEAVALRTHSGGGFWESIGSTSQFGEASPPGHLDGAGSPAWKQRALYDAMRDAAAVTGAVRLARLSVHDVVGGATLNAVLDGSAEVETSAVLALVERRTSTPATSPVGAGV